MEYWVYLRDMNNGSERCGSWDIYEIYIAWGISVRFGEWFVFKRFEAWSMYQRCGA